MEIAMDQTIVNAMKDINCMVTVIAIQNVAKDA